MVICVGELLADMIAERNEEPLKFARFPGGAPFNVACGIAKLGGAGGFYGCVGDDSVGAFLKKFAMDQPLRYCNILTAPSRNTTLAFVDVRPDGERSFCFYRKHTADACFRRKDIAELVSGADILHLGSLPLSSAPARAFYDALISEAKRRGVRISFDINYREGSFSDSAEAVKIYRRYIEAADILKFSQSELELFASKKDPLSVAEDLIKATDKTVLITLGGDGSIALRRGGCIRASALDIVPEDTTGAGDAFLAGVLFALDTFGYEAISEAMKIGSVCGSLTSLKKGAIAAFPTMAEVASRTGEIALTPLNR